jgi:hypothetical protein
MLPWIHSICRVHHRSSQLYLRVVTVRGEGKGETVVTTPVRHGYPLVPTDQAHGHPRQVGPAYPKTRQPVSGPN